jgi:dephospho-CoA kinase
MRILFIGRGGSDKSYLAKYFEKRGKYAIDGDSYPGLSRWEDAKGNVLKDYNPLRWHKSLSVDWYWNPEVLEKLTKRKELYLFGYAKNTFKYLRLFDAVYLLDVNEKVRRQRLGARKSTWGKTEAQIKGILAGASYLRRLARRRGFKIIDASMPPNAIFEVVETDEAKQSRSARSRDLAGA